jgi:hypothetical protein
VSVADGLRARNDRRLRRADAPLNDPSYEPRVQPTIGGGVPPEVALWGPFSQLRWFHRFHAQLAPNVYRGYRLMDRVDWSLYYCDSVQHLGPCCGSCGDDEEYYGPDEDRCCCRAGLPSAP